MIVEEIVVQDNISKISAVDARVVRKILKGCRDKKHALRLLKKEG